MVIACFRLRWPRLCLVVLLGLCLAAPLQAAGPRFIDLAARVGPDESADDTAYHELNRWLMLEFNDLCEDFFCEGAHDNYRPLRLACVVDTRDDTLTQCRFPVSASRDHIDPDTGALRTEVLHWLCPLPLPRRLPVATFLAAMDWQPDSSGHLFNPLPGTGRSMFEFLRDCLP
ncbi:MULTISPECIES: hypothetical protein [Stenotrophomonas]|jgi:hypothetical protein|uniref:Secreted protein n=1 Tax=Stenotrophomonas maltophilia TaxID=40324 RepID=A0A4S2D6Z6_STEMA|nr:MULTISPECIES: hypothetical protein [Stenotrophomonas]MBD3828411.1 hypothetical protein [Stenotrophomonas sp.]QIO89396.1 hypothetical protein G9274_003081 [Stenotrophomonas rhizophila]TGY37025.1 hypothetical protein E5352_00190 [Stenotrophomonas maltophilia]